jgi:hypothetical protein
MTSARLPGSGFSLTRNLFPEAWNLRLHRNGLVRFGNINVNGMKQLLFTARKLADLLRSGLLSPVYHGENGIRTLRELSRSYLALTQDTARVMNRLKALYRSWAIPCAGQRVYAPRYRSEWLAKIGGASGRRSTTSNSTRCGRCASRSAETYSAKAGSTAR